MESPVKEELVSEKGLEQGENGSGSNLKAEQDSEEPLSRMQLFLVMFSGTLAVFLSLLDTSIVATALPKITTEFQSLDDIGWYGTAYFLTNCAVQPISGKIYTHFNVKWAFLTFFAIFELGSALCGAAVSSTMLCIGRAVAGLGCSGLINGALTLVPLIASVDKRPQYQGIMMGISMLGIMCGPLVGGALTEHVTWRWCFYINLPCGAVIALFLLLVPIPNAQNTTLTFSEKLQKLDLIGFVLFIPTILMLIFALQWGGQQYAWGSATIIGLFCGSFGNLLVFLAWEHRIGAQAMIPLTMLRRRIIWSSCLYVAFFIGCQFTTSYYFPIYFQSVRGASAMQSGVDMVPQILTNIIMTVITGALVGRVGYYLPFVLTSGVLTSIGTGLITTLRPHSSTGARVAFQIIQGFQGMGYQIPILAVQNAVTREEHSVATALVVFSQNLSASVFLSVAEVIFSNQLRHFLSVQVPSADIPALIASGASADGIRAAVPDDLLPAVKLAYNDAFTRVMYLATGATCVAFLFATGMGWVRITAKTSK